MTLRKNIMKPQDILAWHQHTEQYSNDLNEIGGVPQYDIY